MAPSPQRIETAKMLGHLIGREDFRATTRVNVPRPAGQGCCFLPCEAETDPTSLISSFMTMGKCKTSIAAIRFDDTLRFLIIRSVADLCQSETMAELYDLAHLDTRLCHMVWRS